MYKTPMRLRLCSEIILAVLVNCCDVLVDVPIEIQQMHKILWCRLRFDGLFLMGPPFGIKI
jgi:hypothetical protein